MVKPNNDFYIAKDIVIWITQNTLSLFSPWKSIDVGSKCSSHNSILWATYMWTQLRCYVSQPQLLPAGNDIQDRRTIPVIHRTNCACRGTVPALCTKLCVKIRPTVQKRFNHLPICRIRTQKKKSLHLTACIVGLSSSQSR